MTLPVVHGHQGGQILLGFLRDPLRALERGFKSFRAPPNAGTPRGDILIPADSLVPILDQSTEGSCGGHATAEADLIEALRGNPHAVMGSRQWFYRCGRATDGTLDKDAGTTFRSIFTMAAKVGIPPESTWPYQAKSGDPNGDGAPTDQFRSEPPAEVVQLAYDRRSTDGVLEAKVIEDVDGDIGDNVDAALAMGHPVGWGGDVGDAFCAGQFDPAKPVDPPSKSVGGHAMVIVGRRVVVVNGTAQRWYRGRNSWGKGFADGGRFWMAESWMRTGDLWVVNRAPAQEAP
jgi:C1A family cysteine protease